VTGKECLGEECSDAKFSGSTYWLIGSMAQQRFDGELLGPYFRIVYVSL